MCDIANSEVITFALIFLHLVAALTKTTSDMRELYLGILYPTEDYKVYPFTS